MYHGDGVHWVRVVEIGEHSGDFLPAGRLDLYTLLRRRFNNATVLGYDLIGIGDNQVQRRVGLHQPAGRCAFVC